MSRSAVAPLPALVQRVRVDAARPLVSYVDLDTGARSELSAAALATWVAKTAEWLELGLGMAPGDRVWLDLPAHWQSTVWCLATWALGGVVLLGPAETVRASGGVAVAAVADPAGYPVAAQLAPDVAAVDLSPFALGLSGLPAGVLDHASEVRAYGDVLAPAAHPGNLPALESTAGVATLDELGRAVALRAAAAGLPEGARVLLAPVRGSSEVEPDRWVRDGVLLPLLLGGSVVLCRGGVAEQHERLAETERATPLPG